MRITPSAELYKNGELQNTVALKDEVRIRAQRKVIEMFARDAFWFAIGVLATRPDKIVFYPDRCAGVTEVVEDQIVRVGTDGVAIRLKGIKFRNAGIMSFF